jgi:PhzF family phenazine biosynthesis protein
MTKQETGRRFVMTIPYFEVVAFTDRLFAGNPAGVCILQEWLPDEMLQKVAAENNLAETAFFIDRGNDFEIRWLSPSAEIDLCGHATIASAHVLFEHLGRSANSLAFHSRSAGDLRVDRVGGRLVLDFPSRLAAACEAPGQLAQSLGAQPNEVFKNRDYIAVFERQEQVAELAPNFAEVAKLEGVQGVCVTAPGNDCDFVSRYFAPSVGVPEDSVTGSTHCALIPYWAKRLGKTKLHARQLSPRGGELFCEDRGERVGIGGTAITYVQGTMEL